MLCDMHTHSKNSHDGKATVDEMAIACINGNIDAFAITDHCDIQYRKEINVFSIIENSVKDAQNAKKKYGDKVKVLTGVEIGEGIWDLQYTKEILNSFPFDAVIGSVHSVRYKELCDPYSTIDFSLFTPEMLTEYMDLYFDELLETVKTVDIDIVAHLTCPLRYINGKYGLNVSSSDYEEKITKILEYIISNSIAMEINTSGITEESGILLPDEWIIEKFRKMGGYLITLGSDAHVTGRVGAGFDYAFKLLKKYNFDSYCYFENRKAIFEKIP